MKSPFDWVLYGYISVYQYLAFAVSHQVTEDELWEEALRNYQLKHYKNDITRQKS
jgi:ABC-type multidrug transport system ATPase subunit